MYLLLSHITKRLYARISSLSWDTVLLLTIVHFLVSWELIGLIGGEEIASGKIFWYFYATTATTVGYGDYSPVTTVGRAITILWIMPGGIALFTVIIAKIVRQISDKWRRRLLGSASYENLTDHTVIFGWHGARTLRMVEQLRGGQEDAEHDIVLCTAQALENPMPNQVKFIRGTALNQPDLLRRAAVGKAKNIIALGHNDDETLVAALGAAAVNSTAHIVAYFDQQSFADLLRSHCPQTECNVSLSIELMVRSAQDPGSSRVQRQLLSTLDGPTQFSLQIPADVSPITYGRLFTELKAKHDATLFGVALSALGEDLTLNAPSEHEIGPGAIIYFIATHRIAPAQIDWVGLHTR